MNQSINKGVLVLGIFCAGMVFTAGSTGWTQTAPVDEAQGLSTQMEAGGVLEIKMGQRSIAMVQPFVFTQGWEKTGFTAPPHPCFYDGFAVLPDGTKLAALKTTLSAKGSLLHVRMALTALHDLDPLAVRAYVSLSYGDWSGDSYQLAGKTGTIPVRPMAYSVIALADPAPLFLGPSHALEGLTLKLDAPELDTFLQDDRQGRGELSAYLNHGEADDKPWHWEAGDYEVFDFTLKFNKDFTGKPN